MKLQSASPVIKDLSRRELLRKLLEIHRKQGGRAAKSTKAIELRYFDDLNNVEVAERLGITRESADQLISHDYRELRRIGVEDFGITGKDL